MIINKRWGELNNASAELYSQMIAAAVTYAMSIHADWPELSG